MRRKKLLAAGLLMSINYAILLVAAFCVMVIMLAYTFLDTVDIANDLLSAIIAPFQIGDTTMNLVFVGGLIVAFIYLLIAATRITKYSKYDQALFDSRKGFAVVFLFSFLIAIGGYAFWLMKNIEIGFETYLPLNMVLAVTGFIHVVSVLLIIIELIKELVAKKARKASLTVDTIESAGKPSIYTAGLDEDQEPEKEDKKETKKEVAQKTELKESDLQKKIIDKINKLDQLRKEGSISTTEYTRLRSQLIKNLTK